MKAKIKIIGRFCIVIVIILAVTPFLHSQTSEKSGGTEKKSKKEIIKIEDDPIEYSEEDPVIEKKEKNEKKKPSDSGKAGDRKSKDKTDPDDLDDDTDDDFDDDLLDEKGPKFKFKGQIKNLYMFKRTNNFMDDNPLTVSTKNLSANLTRLRLSPEFSYSDIFYMTVDFDNELITSSYNKSKDFNMYWRYSGYNDLTRPLWEPYYDTNIYYRIKIHRAYARVSYKFFSATLGRQQIRFGSGMLWNPLDILNPISPTFVEGAEEQTGTDALRLDFYPDDKTEITLVFNPRRRHNNIGDFMFEDCNYIGRVKTSVYDVDFAVLGGYLARRGVAGFDISAVVLDGMLRGSVICSKAEGEDLYFQANAGYEYTFKKGVYLLVEYFFNQNGLNYNFDLKVSYYKSQFNYTEQKDYQRITNQFLTTNQHYVALALGYDFHPLVRGDLFMIYDFQGTGIFFSPALKISAYENLDFSIGFMGGYVFNDKASDFAEFSKHYMYYISGSYVF